MLLAAGAAGLLVAPVQLAGAEGPTRQPTNNQPFVFPAGVACAFPLAVGIVTDREVTTTWPADANGDVRIHIDGTLVLQLTNTVTGASEVVNASGPTRIVVHADGSQDIVFQGNAVLVLQPDATPAGPDTLLTSGRAVETVTPDGHFTLVSVSGRTSDICQQLS